ncbi:MAG: DNA mismatch repair protein MutS [Deferribacteraceae bacterium]|jgi:DNA mismatch repair protein MutS|nr:DNA mismatch repair protein MutS [Deferribacteraceae bacterium]
MPKEPVNTPMAAQFQAIKDRYPDTILFFRMGDFYEMFGSDAELASKVLGIALTSRNKNSENALPMCGVPHQRYQPYAVKLVNAGYNVAICDQLEDPAQAKGLVKRGVTRIITPATMIDTEEVTEAANNFLLSFYLEGGSFFTANADISTGEVYLFATEADEILTIINRYAPKEILTSTELSVPSVTRSCCKAEEAAKRVFSKYKVKDAAMLGVEDIRFFIPLEMIFSYLEDKLLMVNFVRPAFIPDKDQLKLDYIASNTLEITRSVTGGKSLFDILNFTKTAMGARALMMFLRNPTRNLLTINRRLDITEFFTGQWNTSLALQKIFGGIHDIERILNRIASGRVAPRELISLKNSLEVLPNAAEILEASGSHIFKRYIKAFKTPAATINLIDISIKEDAASTLTQGGIIKDGYSREVDKQRDIIKNSGKLLSAKEAELRAKTGIGTLKIAYNKVFGYYIEVSKLNASKVPASFERKQSLVDRERYTTGDIKHLENAILGAEEKLYELECNIFCGIRDNIAENLDELRELSRCTAEVDAYLSLATAAITRKYVRPLVDNSKAIELEGARHPVVEACSNDLYVANDAVLNNDDARLNIITGPNMSGKSTYIRSIALVTLMAHIGSFVPAQKARIGVTDRIFTRVGASDNISYGHSTFMVEMVETANILSHATEDSLLILDEIGRGTSTYDGLSIAWAVAEHIANRVRAKALFATHYHELTDINLPGVKNLTIEVKESGDEVIFMHRIIAGAADKSYGIYVAKLAGLPPDVVKRADHILESLENQGDGNVKPKRESVQIQQILVFDETHPVVKELKELDLDNLTPMKALQLLAELKERAKES